MCVHLQAFLARVKSKEKLTFVSNLFASVLPCGEIICKNIFFAYVKNVVKSGRLNLPLKHVLCSSLLPISILKSVALLIAQGGLQL